MASTESQRNDNIMAVMCPGCQDDQQRLYNPRPHLPNCFKQNLDGWPGGLVLQQAVPGQNFPGAARLPPGLGGGLLQKFDTGATRSADTDKNDYEGFMSFSAIEEFGDYMSRHRVQVDGSVRDSDNWQKGIPLKAYVKSLLRHSLELWGLHRGYRSRRLGREYPGRNFNFLKRETACAIFFNVQGFLHELLKEGGDSTPGPELWTKAHQAQIQDWQKAIQNDKS